MGIDHVRRLYRQWLPLVLVLTALGNLVVHVFLPLSAQPIRPHADGTLTHLVHTEQETVDLRYGFYEELADILVGGTLILPEEPPISIDLVEGLSGVTVVIRDYDPSEFSVTGLIGGTRPLGLLEVGDEEVAYWILPGAGDDRWWLALTGDGVVVLPDSEKEIPGAAS